SLFFMSPPPPRSTLFPYTTLFRSELGGNAPFIVTEDANLDQAVRVAVAAKFQTSGQDCCAANRILVARPLYEQFVEQYTEAVRRSEEHTSELQSLTNLVCRLLLEK